LRRRGKITTRRREGVEKMKKVDELSTKIRVIYLQQYCTNAHRNSGCPLHIFYKKYK